MDNTKQCVFCCSEIPLHAKKCIHCNEFVEPNIVKENNNRLEYYRLLGDLLGKLILPLVILVCFILYKPTVEQLLVKTESADFLGVKISFNNTKGYKGELTPQALYYLIGASDGGGVRYEGDAVRSINELKEKGLITLRISQTTTGSPEMQGTWAEILPTEKGKSFLQDMGVQ